MILSCTILASLGVVLPFRQGSRASWVTGRKFVPKPGLVSWKRGDHHTPATLHSSPLWETAQSGCNMQIPKFPKERYTLKRLLLFINNLHLYLSSCSAAALSVKLEVMLAGRLAGRLPGASGRQSSPRDKLFYLMFAFSLSKGSMPHTTRRYPSTFSTTLLHPYHMG